MYFLRLLKLSVSVVLVFVALGGAAKAQPDDDPIDQIKSKPYFEGTPEVMDYGLIARNVHEKFLQGKYDELEKTAEDYRTSKAAYADGHWKLEYFYNGIDQLPRTDTEAVEYIGKIKAWGTAYPESITAQVALADVMVSYAWKARGNGYASSVGDEAYKTFQSRLQEARLILRKAKTLKARCPVWWLVLARIARGQSWEPAVAEGSFNEGVKFEPDFTASYYERIVFLLPRWYGEEGEWQNFAKTAAKKVGGVKADILYARIVWNVDHNRYNDGNFTENEVSWERVNRGFEALSDQYPNNLSVRSEWARLACIIGKPEIAAHRERAATLFKLIGNRVDYTVFASIDEFTALRNWAYKTQ